MVGDVSEHVDGCTGGGGGRVAARSSAVRLLDHVGCVLLHGVDPQHRRDCARPLLAHHAQRGLHARAPAAEAARLSTDGHRRLDHGRRHLRSTAARLENRLPSNQFT